MIPSIMIWGPPGIGKSQGVSQIANNISHRTGKKVEVTDVRLLLFNPVDLRGIPTANADKTLSVWLKPKIFQMDESDDCINILFLDELSAAPPSVQAAAYQITLDRTIGEHKLPENCIVIAAGNRVTDKSVAYHMPKALANRLCHIEIISDTEEWLKWAQTKGINQNVIGYISTNPSILIDFDPTMESLAFPTPRTWEMVSNILNYVSDDPMKVYPLISGCVGSDIAADFCTWYELYGKIPTIKSILNNTATTVPSRPEALYILTDELIRTMKEKLSKEELIHLINYTNGFPQEFQFNLFAELLKNKKIRPILKECPTFCQWFEETDHYWEDYDL